jgi:hypothetical protein
MNSSTASAIVGALQSVTEALTTGAALSLQQPETAQIDVTRLSSGNDGAVGGPRFVDQGDGTIIDTVNRLQWSKATLTPKCISQHDALRLCEGLCLAAYGDWRLPTRAELITLVDDSRHQPAINVDAFPDTKSEWYWTSTVCAWSSSRAWCVNFYLGDCSYVGRGSSYGLVRAVRSVPAGQ